MADFTKTKTQEAHEDLCFKEIWGGTGALKLKGTSIDGLGKVLWEFISFDKASKKSTGSTKIYLEFEDILTLRTYISSGAMKKKAKQFAEEAAADKAAGGKGYGKNVWVKSNMGSVEKKLARSIDISAPGMVSDFTLTAHEGEGLVTDQGGGKKLITFKDFKSSKAIRVPASSLDVVTLVELSYMMFSAHMAWRFASYKPYSERQKDENPTY